MVVGKNRYFIWLMALLLGMVFLVSGCAEQVAMTESKKQPTIVIGSDRFEPYIYLGDNGEFMGVDVELAKEALHRMGYEAKFKAIVWEHKNEYLKNGTIDCLWGCFSMNGREDLYQWAGPYLYSNQTVAVRRDSGIYKLRDLTGKTVAVQETGKAEKYFLHSQDEAVPQVTKVYAFSRMDKVYSALRKNYVDAIAGHENALHMLIVTAPNRYRMLEEPLFSSKVGVAFRKDYDPAFVKQLDDTLKQMMQDGTTLRIVEKYGLDGKKALSGEKGL